MPSLFDNNDNNGENLIEAIEAIANDGVIAYPTEYCYGLGCHPRSTLALRCIGQLKSRHWRHGMIIVAADTAQLQRYVDTSAALAWRRACDAWPAPLTFVLPARPGLPRWLCGAHDTIACRVSTHPVVMALCRLSRSAIVSTSANPRGARPARTADQVRRMFTNRLPTGRDAKAAPVIVAGRVGAAPSASTIVDAISGKVLRRGAVDYQTQSHQATQFDGSAKHS